MEWYDKVRWLAQQLAAFQPQNLQLFIWESLKIEMPQALFFLTKGRAWGIHLWHPYFDTFPYL